MRSCTDGATGRSRLITGHAGAPGDNETSRGGVPTSRPRSPRSGPTPSSRRCRPPLRSRRRAGCTARAASMQALDAAAPERPCSPSCPLPRAQGERRGVLDVQARGDAAGGEPLGTRGHVEVPCTIQSGAQLGRAHRTGPSPAPSLPFFLPLVASLVCSCQVIVHLTCRSDVTCKTIIPVIRYQSNVFGGVRGYGRAASAGTTSAAGRHSTRLSRSKVARLPSWQRFQRSW
jgi:hypothetical protein